MAQGYVTIGHDTYETWKANTLGQEYDVDGVYGCQCWDYAAEFWYNIGFPQGYPITQSGGNGQAWMCWTYSKFLNQTYNGVEYFDLIYNLGEVKKGDVIVLDGTVQNPAGHIAFADEDYQGAGTIWCIGQNQGGTPSPSGGTAVTRNQLGTDDFLGAFRYKAWYTPAPVLASKKRFPWVLYARKLRGEY